MPIKRINRASVLAAIKATKRKIDNEFRLLSKWRDPFERYGVLSEIHILSKDLTRLSKLLEDDYHRETSDIHDKWKTKWGKPW